MKNKYAQSLAKLRWRGVPAKQRSQTMSDLAKRRLSQLTPEQRSELARKAVQTRWDKARLHKALGK